MALIFLKDVILFAVFLDARSTLSYHDPEETMAECGVRVDHATLKRWGEGCSPLIAVTARRHKTAATRFFARVL
jgi:putative transposase